MHAPFRAKLVHHLHEFRVRHRLPAVAAISATFTPQLEEYTKRMLAHNWLPANVDMKAQKQRRFDAMARAERLVTEASK